MAVCQPNDLSILVQISRICYFSWIQNLTNNRFRLFTAFRNQVFSVVCVEGTFCQLSAEMDNSQYLQQVRWRRTSLQTGVVTDFPDFDGMLSISFNQVSKELHEGVFEVFRENRYLRTWHPIIYLYVRGRYIRRSSLIFSSQPPTTTTGHPSFQIVHYVSHCL